MNKKKLPDLKFKGIKFQPDTERLFLAIYPAREQIEYFRDVIRGLAKEKRNLNFVPIDQIHLTLRFLGANVTEPSRDLLIETFKKYEGQYSKPTIKINSLQLGFDYQNDPRVIFSMVLEDSGLTELAKEIHGILKMLRLRDTIRWKEKKSLDFHFSIARLKGYAGKNIGKQVNNSVNKIHLPFPASYTPETFEIVKSKITGGAPLYKKLFSVKL